MLLILAFPDLVQLQDIYLWQTTGRQSTSRLFDLNTSLSQLVIVDILDDFRVMSL